MSERPGITAAEPALVSIVVITYNDRRHVAQAIESALAQSHPHREVIVVDDGSTDGTQADVEARFGDSIRYIYQPNGGMGSARAAGIGAARGMYIQHLDSDDLLLPDKIAHQVEYLEGHPETAFVYGRSLCFYDDDLAVRWEHHANERARSGNLFDAILAGGNFVNVIQPLFRASWIERVGGWDAQARVADDYDIMVRLAYAGAVGHFLDEPVFLYRQRRVPFDADLEDPARWRSIEVLARGEIYILGRLAARIVRDGRPGLATIRKRIGAAEFSLGWGLFRAGRRWESCGHILRGLRSNRERWPYKVMVLVGAALLPGQRLLRLKRWLAARSRARDRSEGTIRPPKWLRLASGLMRRAPPFRGRWRLASLLHSRLAGRGWAATTRVNGYAMRLLLDDLIGRSTYVDGIWERENTEVAEKLLRPGARVFDVGANAGYFSLLFASLVGPTGQVFAFEPVRSTADRWRANLALNPSLQPQTTLFEIALSDTAGTVEMEIDGAGNTGASHVVRADEVGATWEGAHASRSTAVGRTGDEVWAELGRPSLDLVKMDIEGHEMFALCGMPSLLRESAQLSVLIEVRDHALRAAGGSRDDVFALMSGHGFHSYDYSRATRSFTRNDEPRDGELIVFSKRAL